MKVKGLLLDDKIAWKKFDSSSEKFLKYQKAEDSIPKKDFKINVPITDKNGITKSIESKTIKEITIVRGSDDDVIGFLW